LLLSKRIPVECETKNNVTKAAQMCAGTCGIDREVGAKEMRAQQEKQ
jgi:hypothetical protein